MIPFSKYLLIYCALMVTGSDGDKTCLEPKQNIYDTQEQALMVYDQLSASKKDSAILYGGNRLDILSRYEVKPSTK